MLCMSEYSCYQVFVGDSEISQVVCKCDHAVYGVNLASPNIEPHSGFVHVSVEMLRRNMMPCAIERALNSAQKLSMLLMFTVPLAQPSGYD